MDKKTDGPSLGADIWVDTPKAFLFLIYRMLTEKGLDCSGDLWRFLETDHIEVEEFLEANIPPAKWLLKLAKNQEGRGLLRLFDLPDDKKIIRAVCKIFRDDLDVLLEHLLEGEASSHEAEDLKEELNPEPTPEPESEPKLELELVLRPVPVPVPVLVLKPELVPVLVSKPEPVPSLELANSENKVKKRRRKTGPRKASEKEKLVADPKIQFLAGMHSVTGMLCEELLKKEFGAEEMARFKRDGIIPAKWQALLPAYAGGQKLLERFGEILVLAKPVEPEPEPEPEPELVPFADVFRVFKIIKDEAGLKDDSMLAPILGLDVKGITDLRKGKNRLHSGHINAILAVVKVNPELLSQWL